MIFNLFSQKPTNEEAKRRLAHHVAKLYSNRELLGVGGGTTVAFFIEELAKIQKSSKSVLIIASSKCASLAKKLGFPTLSWRSCRNFEIYIDGADFISPRGYMLKGLGGAALGEKLISSQSEKFICLFEKHKYSKNLTDKPIYLEVLPAASSIIAHELLKYDISIGFIDKYSELEHWIMEAHIKTWPPLDELDNLLNSLPGIISHGLFLRRADLGYVIDEKFEIESVNFT